MIISSLVSSDCEKISRISSSSGRSQAFDIRGEGALTGGSGGVLGQTKPIQDGLWSVISESKGFINPPIEVMVKGVSR